jgi:uncharacterized protein (TIGR00369 family)
MLDGDGALPAGGLAVLVDSALGNAIMTNQPSQWGLVTSHLHLELLRPVPGGAGELTCVAEQCSLDDSFGLADGDVRLEDGTVLAKATIGSVVLDAATRSDRAPVKAPPATSATIATPTRSHPQAHRLTAGEPVLEGLGLTVLRAGRTGVRAAIPASPRLANSSGGLHGGFGVLMGERTLDLALRAALDREQRMRPVELRASFLRPIIANGSPIECHAAVLHLGRRLAAARGEVRDHRGRPAVLVDATYLTY